MEGVAALVVMLSAMAAFYVVESQQRTCYFGPPPEPDPDHPGDWMKQVMQKVRERCPGRRQSTPAAHSTTGDETTPASQTTIGKKTTPIGHTTKAEKTTPAGHATVGEGTTPIGHTTVGEETTQTAQCLGPLGMEDGTISDDQISASCSITGYPPWEGRLNSELAWRPWENSTAPEWVEVDLRDATTVSGVITQGHQCCWVTQYMVSYAPYPPGPQAYMYAKYSAGEITNMFDANTDATTPVTNVFDESVAATAVRIELYGWRGIAFRFELLGCRM